MELFGITFIFLGLIIFILSKFLIFNPFFKYLNNENLTSYNFENENIDRDKIENEDDNYYFFEMIVFTKRIIYGVSVFFVFVGIITYCI